MKTLLLAVTILSAVLKASIADAFLAPVDVEYTGRVAERFDFINNYIAGSSGGYLGGPVTNNSLGGAFQFRVEHTVHVNYLLATARVRADFVPDGQTTSMDFNFKLYTKTINSEHWGIIPDIGSLVITAPMRVETGNYTQYIEDVGMNHTFNQDGYYKDVPLPFDIKLKKGTTYWIARERGYGQGGPIVDQISTKFARIHNPEPATLVLMGGGMIGAFWRRRKVVKV